MVEALWDALRVFIAAKKNLVVIIIAITIFIIHYLRPIKVFFSGLVDIFEVKSDVYIVFVFIHRPHLFYGPLHFSGSFG